MQKTTPITERSPSEDFQNLIRDSFSKSGVSDWLLYPEVCEFVADTADSPHDDRPFPIHEFLEWDLKRFTHEARQNLSAYLFPNENGIPWQAIISQPSDKKPYQYMAPVKAGNTPYLPAIIAKIRIKIADRHGLHNTSFFTSESDVFWDWVEAHPEIPIVITEGVKKALSLLQQGHVAIALYGCTCLDSLGLERFLPDREIILAMDCDQEIETRLKVGRAIVKGCESLSSKGAKVRVAVWDSPHAKGIDDLAKVRGIAEVNRVLTEAISPERFAQIHNNLSKEYRETVPKQLKDFINIKKTLAAKGSVLRYNLLTKEIELDGKPFEVGDAALNLAIDHHLILHSGEEQISRICTRIAKEKSYSPVRDYLESAYDQYKHSPRIEHCLKSLGVYLGTNKLIHQKMLEKTLIAAVARAYKPKEKVDSMLILAGLQGAGKSSFFRTLASPEWFDDSLDLDTLGDTDSRLQLHSSWISEFQEAEQLFSTKKQRGTLKGFLTTQTDRVRRPYGRCFENLDRHFIIVGTTNHQEFLDDPTGNRRFWVVPVTKQIPLERLEAERDLLWAAAVVKYKRGESWELTPAEKEEVATLTRQYESQDPWLDAIENYCDLRSKVSITEIFEMLEIEPKQQGAFEKKRITAILTSLKFTSLPNPVSHRGKKQRVWGRDTPLEHWNTNGTLEHQE